MNSKQTKDSPWRWVPTLYLAEGFPNAIVTALAVLMLKRFGVGNAAVGLYTLLLALPWIFKPLWMPIVDAFRTKRWWIRSSQFVLAAVLFMLSVALFQTDKMLWILALLLLFGVGSATHDIAADAYYSQALSPAEQTFFFGIRTTFFRFAVMLSGLLTMVADLFEIKTRSPQQAWAYTFFVAAIGFCLLFLSNRRLPKAEAGEKLSEGLRSHFGVFWQSVGAFFRSEDILPALLFLLLFRLSEAMLSAMSIPFCADAVEQGGLGLTTSEVGLLHTTIAMLGACIGGFLGSLAISKSGFKRWLWPMVLSVSLPNVVYIALAYYQPESFALVSACILFEQFGYGFGLCAFTLYLVHLSKGPSRRVRYPLCLSLAFLGLKFPAAFAGWLQEYVGYLNFFVVVAMLTPITFIVAALVRVPSSDFGIRPSEQHNERQAARK